MARVMVIPPTNTPGGRFLLLVLVFGSRVFLRSSVADLGEGARPRGGTPLFWVKKEKLEERRKAGRARKPIPHPHPQSLSSTSGSATANDPIFNSISMKEHVVIKLVKVHFRKFLGQSRKRVDKDESFH